MVMVECPRCGEKSAAGRKCSGCGLLLDKENNVEIAVTKGATEVPAAVEVQRAAVVPKKRKLAIRECLECHDEKRIIGRGLCGRCYPRLKSAGLLDEKYPLKSVKGEKKEKEKKGELVAGVVANGRVVEDREIPVFKFSAAVVAGAAEEIMVPVEDRDRRLFDCLEQLARRERRTVAGQILYLLDKFVDLDGAA